MKGRNLVELFKEGLLKVGDEISYHTVDAEYVSKAENNGLADQAIFWNKYLPIEWQVFGKMEYAGFEVITIISKTALMPIRLRGAVGYLKGPAELNQIANKLFGKGQGGMFAQNISFSEIDRFLKIKYMGNHACEEGREEDYFGVWNRVVDEKKINGWDPQSFIRGNKERQFMGGINYMRIRKENIENENANMLFLKNQPYWIGNCSSKDTMTKTASISVEPDYVEEHEWGEIPINSESIDYTLMIGWGEEIAAPFYLFKSTGAEKTLKAGLRPIVYLRPDATMEMLEEPV